MKIFGVRNDEVRKKNTNLTYPSNIFQFVRFMRFVFPIIVPSSLTTPLSLGEGSGGEALFNHNLSLSLAATNRIYVEAWLKSR